MSNINKIKAVLNEINESSKKYPGNFKSDSCGDIWNDSIFNPDDIKDAEGLHPVLLTTLNVSDSELASYFVLAVNTITQLTKAVDLAAETLAQISSESATTESSYDDLVKLENRITKKAYLTIKTIAEILETTK